MVKGERRPASQEFPVQSVSSPAADGHSISHRAEIPFILPVCLFFTAALFVAQAQESIAKQFLRHVYGAEGIELGRICHPSDDLWMLGGARNDEALAAIDGMRIGAAGDGIVSGVVRSTMYFFELRDGLVDASFTLDGVLQYQRRLALEFLYACLSHDLEALGQLTTDPARVRIVGPAPPSGEMGQYASIIELMPVVRSSSPVEDAKSRTVTYRVPIGDRGLSMTMMKVDGRWKIDTRKTMVVSLEFFYR